jgi:hypothetical protein
MYMYMYRTCICTHIQYTSVFAYIFIYNWKMELTENGNLGKSGNGKLPFVCCNQKQKTEVCFLW